MIMINLTQDQLQIILGALSCYQPEPESEKDFNKLYSELSQKEREIRNNQKEEKC